MDLIDEYIRQVSNDSIEKITDLEIEVIEVDADSLDLFQNNTGLSYTLAFRYFCALNALKIQETDFVLEVGGAKGDFYKLAKNKSGEYLVCDLDSAEGRVPQKDFLKINVVELNKPIVANKIYLGHTFEHFRSNDDILFCRKLRTLLDKNGMCVIEPLFVGQNYLEINNKHESENYISSQTGARVISTQDSNFPGNKVQGMGFGRVYDLNAFSERVLDTLKANNMRVKILAFSINGELLPNMSKFDFKRQQLNYPYRLLEIKHI